MGFRLAVVFLAAVSAACDVRVGEKGVSLDLAEGRASDEWTRAYPLPAGARFELENGNGHIQVFPATGAQVEIRAEREVRARSDEAAADLLRRLQIEEQVSPALVRIVTPRGEGSGFRENVRVEYRVNLPQGSTAAFTTANGNIRLENVEGELRASSTNGSIEARGIAGGLEASTINGGITAELARVTGDVRATTVNGGIRVAVPADVNAMLEASTVNGAVLVAEGLPLSGPSRQRQRVTGRLNDGGPTIRLQTTNGGIRLGVQGDGEPGRIEETRSP